MAEYNASFDLGDSFKNISISTDLIRDTYDPRTCRFQLSTFRQIVITVIYVIGASGNFFALTILYRSGKQLRNKKIILMLRCLAYNDLVALLGMLVQMNLNLYLPLERACSVEFCGVRVIWRSFGLGSGCVAVVMAVERWLALTRPFLYQKYITYNVIRKSIFSLWIAVGVLACLPFFGFGLYFQHDIHKCMRYRDAKTPLDKAYAYLFFTIGTLLCVCIVMCNLAVIRVLCHLGCRGTRKKVVWRRISRTRSVSSGSSTTTTGVINNGGGDVTYYNNASTPEELAFAKLMAVVSVGFVICWMPQMITILLAQWAPTCPVSSVFYKIADLLMMLHFTLDPFFYVLLRCQRRPCFSTVLKLMCRTCWTQSNTGSHPTSLAMTDHEHCPSLDPDGQPSAGRDTAAAV